MVSPRGAQSARASLATRDFDRLYRAPDRHGRSRHFLVVAGQRPGGEFRWGLTVKARLGNAVERNRVKRRVREMLRRYGAQLPPGWDVVVQPRTREVARANFAALSRELEELLEKTLCPSQTCPSGRRAP